jgi:type IV pilus assembly protein PilW
VLSGYLNGIVLPLIGNNRNKAMCGKIQKKQNENGFTLVELLVALAISGVVMAGIYSAYYSQQKSYVTQEQVAAMQQNLRAAMYIMQREIRMAGCDPTQNANAGIQTAGTNNIGFTLDITNTAGTGNPDGLLDGPNENVTYSLYDSGGDGDNDLGRDTGAGNQPVAENIDALDFVYLDANGATTTTLANIRSVQITLVARTGRRDPGYTNNTSYQNQQDTTIYTAPNDNFRRKLLTAEVKCRNLGL